MFDIRIKQHMSKLFNLQPTIRMKIASNSYTKGIQQQSSQVKRKSKKWKNK